MVKLYGWDTAYATKLSELNKSLATAHNLPRHFTQTWINRSFDCTVSRWDIVKGGAGKLLHIQATIGAGTFISSGQKSDLSGVTIIFEVDLTLLPESAGHTSYHANIKTAGKKGDKAGDGVVVPYAIDVNGHSIGFLDQLFLMNYLAKSLVGQAAAFTFAFAQINLVPPTVKDTWLTPVEIAYDVYGPQNGDDHLVIYTATRKRDVSLLPHQVDPDLMTGAGPAYFAFSKNLFLENIVKPVMPDVFANSRARDFLFDPAHSQIESTVPIAMDKVKSGLIWYHPVITKVVTTVSKSNIETRVQGVCDLHLGMSMTFVVSSSCPVTFDAATSKVTVHADPSPQTSHDTHVPWYDYLAGAIPDIIIAIVVPIIGNGIAKGMNRALGNLAISSAGPQSVSWPGGTVFQANAGFLDDGFQLSGT